MWAAILCADWSKNAAKREVYAASPNDRHIGRLAPPAAGWTMASLLAMAEGLRPSGSVLVGVDAPIGVPASYLQAVRSSTFPAWLPLLHDAFFEPVADPSQWSLARPFVRVPPGEGSRRAIEDRMVSQGIDPRRRIDRLARAQPCFIVSGIAGSVGSAAIDVWRGLATAALRQRAAPLVWPFDGSLADCANSSRVVVGEIYPRLAYALASAPSVAVGLRPVTVAKTVAAVRNRFVDSLLHTDGWPGRLDLWIEDHEAARRSEDAFDAFVTAIALLRCLLEGIPLSDPALEDPIAEGGILGSGGVRLGDPEILPKQHPILPPRTPGQRGVPVPRAMPSYRCPIPGCSHTVRTGRGGWDSHVGSLRRHPAWHPDVPEAERRKALFRAECPDFFRPGPAS